MIFKNTYIQFWICIPLVFVLTLVLPETIDLFVYVDHYRIKPVKIAIFLSGFMLLSGFGYYVNRKKEMNPSWTKVHKKYTLVGFSLCILTFLVLLIKNGGLTEPMVHEDFEGFSSDQLLALVFILGTFILFLGFLVYFINTAITTFFTE